MNQVSLWRRPLAYRFYNATIALIVVNGAFFVLLGVLPVMFRSPGLMDLARRVTTYLALVPEMVVRYPAIWQVVTYMFLHGGFWHLAFNMLALLMFGSAIERRWGSSEFLLYYFVTGVGAGIATVAVNWYTGLGYVAVIGASGAIFGILLAFATMFPDARVLLFWFLPVRAPVAVLVFIAIELWFLLRGTSTGVAHLTHLAGLGFGYLYFVIRMGINPLRVFFRRF
ncbi:MAG: rhomboid family intramembrane serine protease [Spirochaetales bacterium]|nr:rhomboid family intramembrane serine protease [Spirochaetales bacterium]